MSDLTARLIELLQSHPVVFALLYGSHAQGKPLPVSDIDVAIYTDELDTLLDISVELNEAFAPTPVDVVNLKGKPSPMYYEILRTGTLLFVRDEAFFVEEKYRVMREYLDFKPVLEQMERDMYQRIKDGTYGQAPR